MNRPDEVNKQTILIVDDEENIREIIKASFSDRYQVKEAANGVEALVLINEQPPDLMILDWMMPTLNGTSVIERLKKNPDTAFIPILMLTAKGAVNDLVTGLHHGADDFIKKPFDLKELAARIEAMLRWVRMSRFTDAATGLPSKAAIQEALESATKSAIKKSVAVMVPIGIEKLDGESMQTLISYLKNLAVHTLKRYFQQEDFIGILEDRSLVLMFPAEHLTAVARDILANINEVAGYGGTPLDHVKIKLVFLAPNAPLPSSIEQMCNQVRNELSQVSNFRRHECRVPV